MLPSFTFSVLVGFLGLVAALPGSARPATGPTVTKAPVDQLIPWLLDEDRQMRAIAFAEVIFDATGKHVLPVDPKKRDRSASN
jgi:hypothetical protein